MSGIVSFEEFDQILMDENKNYGVLEDRHIVTNLLDGYEERQLIVVDKKGTTWSFNYAKNKIGKVNYLRMGEKVKPIKVSSVEYF